MSIGNALRLITPLLLAALSFLASPARAVTLGPLVNVSHDRGTSGGFSNQVAASESNVYVVWSEGPFLFSRSTDGGISYGAATTLFSGAANAYSGIAASGSNVYVSRSERAKPQAAPQVVFRRSLDGGATFASQVQLSTSLGGNFQGMAASGSNVYVVFTANPSANSEVYLSRSNDGGASFFPPVNLSNTAANTGTKVSVLADGSSVYVAWGENGGIFFTASSDGGASFGSLISIPVPGAFPTLAASGSNVYIAYSYEHMFVVQSIDGGLTFGAPTDVSGASAVNPPQITANGSDVHLVWQSTYPPGGPYDVLYAHSTTAGASYSLRTMSNSAAQFTGVVAASGSHVYVSWSDGSEVLLAHSGDSGNNFDPTVNVSETSGASAQVTTVATSTGIQHSWIDNTTDKRGNWDTFCRAGTP